MKVLFAAAEASPFIKVGGLGDVMGGLPKELVSKGIDARVILPLYSAIKPELREKINKDLRIDCPIATFHSTGNAILRINDPEQLNINQLDLPIQNGEQIEIQIKSMM